jgi:hypothetical protein
MDVYINYCTGGGRGRRPEDEFLDEIQTKVLRVFLRVIHSHFTHKVHIYKEYHSVPRPNWDLSLASECAPPPRTGEGNTRLGARGWGSPNSDDW